MGNIGILDFNTILLNDHIPAGFHPKSPSFSRLARTLTTSISTYPRGAGCNKNRSLTIKDGDSNQFFFWEPKRMDLGLGMSENGKMIRSLVAILCHINIYSNRKMWFQSMRLLAYFQTAPHIIDIICMVIRVQM